MISTQGPAATIALALFTMAVYAAVRRLHVRCGQHPLLHPVFASALVLILFLSLTHLGFAPYRPTKEVLAWFLGPATVALAVPVYNQRRRLWSLSRPLAAGVGAGALATTATVLVVGWLLHLPPLVLHSLAFKSVTAPIAVELARLYSADPSLTVGFVVCTGVIGGMIGPRLLTRIQVSDPASRGIALGTTAHAIGTAAALSEGESAGALAGLAMVLNALLTSLLGSFYVPLMFRALGA